MFNFYRLSYLKIFLTLLLFLFLSQSLPISAQRGDAFIEEVRAMDLDDLNLRNLVGLTFSPDANVFMVVSAESKSQTTITTITPFEEVESSLTVDVAINDGINMAFDNWGNRLLLYEKTPNKVAEIKAKHNARLPAQLTNIPRYSFGKFGIKDPQGATIDHENGDFFILDRAKLQIVRIRPTPAGGFKDRPPGGSRVSRIDLDYPDLTEPRGLALNPSNGHLYFMSPAEQKLYEITETGQLVTTFDMSPFNLIDPQGLVFADSGDPTDDHNKINLYLADSGLASNVADQAVGRIIEFSLTRPPGVPRANSTVLASQNANPVIKDSQALIFLPLVSLWRTQSDQEPRDQLRIMAVPNDPVVLERLTDTSLYSPPSPDPAGVVYLPNANSLLISDSEVNEIPALFTGDNVFETTLPGSLIGTFSTIVSSDTPPNDEPTGVAYNPANDHLFFSDDTSGKWVHELNPGPDGQYDTADDIRTKFTTTDFGSNDPEGITFDTTQNRLMIIDGLAAEVYIIAPGANGIFDGVPPSGDDQVTNFDVSSFGLLDPEGIAYNADLDHLYILSGSRDLIIETLPDGTLIRNLDISSLNYVRPSGLAYGPSSSNPSDNHLYFVDRGIDNGADPNENDGRLYEISFPPAPPHLPPTVDAGTDQTITLPADASLDGTVTDDGLPNPPGAVTTTWSQFSGPGTATFANPSAVDTTASFTSPGSYVLRLTADDGDLSNFDDVTITVIGSGGEMGIQVSVSDGDDDAEESATGSVSITNGDLELVFDKGGNQTVGMRFDGVNIPPGALINNAFIQFMADETDSGTTTLNIQGEATANAATFSAVTGNISSRSRTASTVVWSPPPWNTVGEAGLDQRTADIASVIQEIVNQSGWASGNALAIIITGTGERVAESYNGFANGAPSLFVEYIDTGQSSPTVNAGPDQTIILPNDANLDGTVTDDGLPNPPGAVTTTWSQVSGPGTTTFANPNAVDTTASFSAPGSYVLRLTADDSQLTNNDEVTITVDPGHLPPTVDAGPDQTITLPASANLDGTVTDDGLPNPPGAVTTTWSQVSGPGTATFADPSAVDTTVSFSNSGSYVLRLTADDSQLTNSDDITVTVLSPSGGTEISIRVAAKSDDAEERVSGQVSFNSSDLELVYDKGGNQTVGMRFNGVTIPQGATINSASLQFQVDEVSTNATSLTIQGEATDNAATFSTASGSISARPKTSGAIAWSPPPWATIGDAGPDQQTPNIALVIQEIINRPGWASGNSLVILITGTGERVAESYNGSSSGAPLLTIDYLQ